MGALAATGIGTWFVWDSWAGDEADDALTWTVSRRNLRITVSDRGTLESQKTVNGTCELHGYENKIIFIVEEGDTVKKGDIVVRFDGSEINKAIAQAEIEVNQATGEVDTTRQEVEIEKNKGESEIAAAQLELTLAELDLEKYKEGDSKVEESDLRGKIALAKVALDEAQDVYDNTRKLVKKGFREPKQLRAAGQSVDSAKFNVARDERALDVLKNYDYTRKLTEFEAKFAEAKRKLVRANATAAANVQKAQSKYEAAQGALTLQEANLKDKLQQQEKCEIIAEQDGVVAYANEEWWSESRRIREGGTVYQRQVVFSLPDMAQMQVKAKVHEAEIRKVKAGQKAVIRVEAFANQSFPGTVKSVAQLSESDNYLSAGIKEYTTIVTLDDTPSVPLRPGMTAEVEILVDDLSDVLAVPVQAVTEQKHEQLAYLKTGTGYERRPVEIGQSNNRFLMIISGLEEGMVVALDARVRGAEEFDNDKSPQQSEDRSEDSEFDNLASDEPASDEPASEVPATEIPAADKPSPAVSPGTTGKSDESSKSGSQEEA